MTKKNISEKNVTDLARLSKIFVKGDIRGGFMSPQIDSKKETFDLEHFIKTYLGGNDSKNFLKVSSPEVDSPLSLPEDQDDSDEFEWDDPRSVKEYLDEFVFGQDAAKKTLAVAFADYMTFGKQSHTLLVGPSGSGKTYMLELLCEKAKVPFVKKSMSNLTAPGYKGESLDTIFSDFKPIKEFAMFGIKGRKATEKAIILLDEIDKLALSGNDGTTEDVTPRKNQQALLGYLTGEKIVGVDTSKYLFVTAGAFNGGFGRKSLSEIIQRRLGGSQAKISKQQVLENMTDADIIEYGFLPELVGRLTNKATLQPIDEEGLYRILAEKEDTPIKLAVNQFKQLDIDLDFEDDALREIAKLAINGVGVRGLHGVVENLISDYSFNRKEYCGKSITITSEMVRDRFDVNPEFIEPDNFEIDWMNPKSIMGYLDQYVVGQTGAKKELAKAFHLYHVGLTNGGCKMPKANVMLIGPSGSGKTYMVELLAKKAKLPMGKTNIADKVPSSMVGQRFQDVFDQLGRSQTGIVYIDEVDKVLSKPAHPLNNELLTCLENGEVNGRDTGGYLFILSGACQNVYEAKVQKSSKDPIGLHRRPSQKNPGEVDSKKTDVCRNDLLSLGYSREILGRIPIIANTQALSAEELAQILTIDGSVMNDYMAYFDSMGKEVEIDSEVYSIMGEKAQGLQGARGLSEVANKLFDYYMVNICDYEGNIQITGDDARRILE
jgi:ATP-dependent Clp protease ATP-binding subunit ClpX